MVLLGHGSGSWSPHRGWKASTFLKIPRWDGASASIPCTLGTGSRPIPMEAMKSIRAVKLTGRHYVRPSHDVQLGGPLRNFCVKTLFPVRSNRGLFAPSKVRAGRPAEGDR